MTGVSGVGIVERALPTPTVNAQVSKQQTLEPDLDPISRLAKVLSLVPRPYVRPVNLKVSQMCLGEAADVPDT